MKRILYSINLLDGVTEVEIDFSKTFENDGCEVKSFILEKEDDDRLTVIRNRVNGAVLATYYKTKDFAIEQLDLIRKNEIIYRIESLVNDFHVTKDYVKSIL